MALWHIASHNALAMKNWVHQSEHGIAEMLALTDLKGGSGRVKWQWTQEIIRFPEILLLTQLFFDTDKGMRKCVQDQSAIRIRDLNMNIYQAHLQENSTLHQAQHSPTYHQKNWNVRYSIPHSSKISKKKTNLPIILEQTYILQLID